MSFIDEELLTCFYCNRRFQNPVLLPCNEAICSKHIKELRRENSFGCPKCKQIHPIPNEGLPSDKKIQQILKLQESHQKNFFSKLNELYEKYTELKQNPFLLIQSHFEKIKKIIIECRDENKKILDALFEKYLEEMRLLELDEKEKISQNLKPYPSDDDSNSSDYWRSKIDKLEQQSDKKGVDALKSEVLKLEKKLERKIFSLEQNAMPNNLAIFVGKLLDSVELGSFEKKKHSRDGPIQIDQRPTTQIMCLAVKDYDSKKSDELIVRKGDRFFVRENGESSWLVSRDGEIGYVSPKLLAEIWQEEWFVGKMDRNEAVSLLSKETNMCGSFMVRFSNPITEDQIYSLSVRNKDGNIKHYIICREQDANGFWSYWLSGAKFKFNSISDLVAFYMQKSNGICTELTSPCNKKFSI